MASRMTYLPPTNTDFPPPPFLTSPNKFPLNIDQFNNNAKNGWKWNKTKWRRDKYILDTIEF